MMTSYEGSGEVMGCKKMYLQTSMLIIIWLLIFTWAVDCTNLYAYCIGSDIEYSLRY